MLRTLTLTSVKCFLDRTSLRFAPLTLIAGANSSGKSTIFQSLLLVKQNMESPPSLPGALLNGRYIALGSYQDWRSKHELNTAEIEIGLESPDQHVRAQSSRHLAKRGGRSSARAVTLKRALWPVGLPPGAKSTYSLTLEFEPHEVNPNAAGLRSMKWEATSKFEDHSDSLKMTVTVAEQPANEEDDRENDLEYTMTVDRDAGIASATRRSVTRCSVEGLLPDSALEETDRPAEIQTIAEALQVALRAVYGSTEERETGSALLSGHTADLERFKRLIEVAPDEKFYAKAPSHFMLAYTLVDGFGSARFRNLNRKRRVALVNAVTAALIDRLLKRVPEGDVSAALRQSIEILKRSRPAWSDPLRLLQSFAAGWPEPNLRNRVQSLVLRAAEEAADGRRSLRRVPAERFSALAPRLASPSETRPVSPEAMRRYLTDFTFHLGPLREEPRNLYVTDLPSTPQDVGKRGERAITCLRQFGAALLLSPIPGAFPLRVDQTTLLDATSAWGRYLGLFGGLDVDSSTKYGTICRVTGRTDDAQIQSDLTNVGVGVSQLLPVLVLCLAAPPGSIVLIEQPELHLHPSVQTRLAEFFAAMILTGRQILIETHSEHLLGKIRLMVADGQLRSSEDVTVLFVERDDFGSSVREIAIAPDGSIGEWPKGFFDEAEHVLKELLARRLGKQRVDG